MQWLHLKCSTEMLLWLPSLEHSNNCSSEFKTQIVFFAGRCDFIRLLFSGKCRLPTCSDEWGCSFNSKERRSLLSHIWGNPPLTTKQAPPKVHLELSTAPHGGISTSVEIHSNRQQKTYLFPSTSNTLFVRFKSFRQFPSVLWTTTKLNPI